MLIKTKREEAIRSFPFHKKTVPTENYLVVVVVVVVLVFGLVSVVVVVLVVSPQPTNETTNAITHADKTYFRIAIPS